MDQRARKRRDGSGPKLLRRDIRLHHAHFPWSRKPPPDLMGRLGSDSTPPVCAKNKELRHIPNGLTARYIRAFLDESQPCQFAIQHDQERMPVRLRPIKRKGLIAEPAILS